MTKPEESTTQLDEPEPHRHHHSHPLCPRCGIPFTARIKRSFLVKFLFRSYDSRRYVCGSCKRTYYIMSKELE